MKLSIPKDQLLNPVPSRVFLCTTSTKIIGELPATNRQLNAKWNSYSEFSFDIQRTYVDILTGETKVHPLYDKVEAPRNILVENLSYFALQDIDDTSNDNDIKSASAFSLEYATSNKYLTNWHINTGEVDSKEVLYNESIYGIDYNTDQDSFYKLASGDFSSYQSYYQQVYTSADQYTYEQIQVKDEQDFRDKIANNDNPNAHQHEKLYVKKFSNVQFYNPDTKGLSLLHLIFENIPEWTIGNVDQALWLKERRFSEDRISVYDFVQNNVHDTFGCVPVWDSLSGKVHFYEELEDDSEEQNDVSTRFETDVFISKDNLASECRVSYSSDNIKTKLVVAGSDDLNIREVNLGRNEIMNLSFYHNLDWMEQDLYDAYNTYLSVLQEAESGLDEYGFPSTKFPMSYSDAMKGWVSANNSYTDLVNAVPAEGNVVLVGDTFKKLYCTYSPLDTAYATITIGTGTQYVDVNVIYLDEKHSRPIPEPTHSTMYVVQGVLLIYDNTQKKFNVDPEWESKKFALIKQLNLYHVDEDTEANKQDNILIKLKNATSDVATIRIYDKRVEATYYDERLQYYSKDKNGKYSKRIDIKDATHFDSLKNEFAEKNTTIWTNDYYVQSMITYADSGANGVAKLYPILDWIKGELTAESMSLTGYNVTYIGTMGAYFVLAKDEQNPDNLQDYGVKLLEEKHKLYTTIFQTQTEAMLSQEKYQCIVQDEQPEGDYPIGTRWLDTNNNPIQLMEYRDVNNVKTWVVISAEVSESDRGEYENYQRYIDNYTKLQAVQQVLTEKRKRAEYSRYGYVVQDRIIPIKSTDGSSLMENMNLAALSHFNGHTVVAMSINTILPLYTFTTSFDPIVYGKNSKDYQNFEQYYIKQNYVPVIIDGEEQFNNYNGTTETNTLYVASTEKPTTYTKNGESPFDSSIQYYVKNSMPEVYIPIDIDENMFNQYDGTTEDKTLYVVTGGHKYVVYLQDNKPHIAYENSQGVYDMIMQYIRDNIEMNKFFTVDQWIRLSPFIKEDEFNDSNFFLTEYDSEEEKQRITKELMDAASKELKTLCKPSLEFSMTMANILALPEFESLLDQFQLGNFIKVEIRNGYVKRARLLEVNINFDDLSSFDCVFGNLVTTKSEIDKHADLLKTAVTAGKQVAKSSGTWQRAVDQTNQLQEDISNGLKDAALAIGSASGQAISWDSTGMHFRKYKDGSTTEFEPEEMAIINNALVATNDSWQTAKSSFGKYYINGEEKWGPVAEYVTAQTIEGKHISGGSIAIGDGDTKFLVNSDGSVEIRSGNTNYIHAMKEIDDAYRYQTILTYDNGTIFSDINDVCTLTCSIYDYSVDITQKLLDNGAKFSWFRTSYNEQNDGDWNAAHANQETNTLIISAEDIIRNSTFSCSVEIDDSILTPEEDTV